jgi:hypothetical protein
MQFSFSFGFMIKPEFKDKYQLLIKRYETKYIHDQRTPCRRFLQNCFSNSLTDTISR